MVYKLFDKKSAGSGVNMHANNKIEQNHQLAENLHKPMIQKFQKREVYSGFKDLIFKDIISKFNEESRFLLCIIYIFSKHT